MTVKHRPRLLTPKKKKKRIQAFEPTCQRKLLRISYLEHKTNDWVRTQINPFVGPQEPIPATVKRRKLAWFGHESLSKTTLQGTSEKGRCHGRQRKCWMDNIKQQTSLTMPGLLTRSSCRKDWKRISAEFRLLCLPRRPNRSRD